MAACLSGYSGSSHVGRLYGAHGVFLGELLGLLGWNMAVPNLR
nr:hypothetical protein [Mycobacterium lepromatosis]